MSETTVQGNIVMNEQLNIAIDRVEKLDDPLLVIAWAAQARISC